jgi:hypothetical protein
MDRVIFLVSIHFRIHLFLILSVVCILHREHNNYIVCNCVRGRVSDYWTPRGTLKQYSLVYLFRENSFLYNLATVSYV